MTKLRPMLLIVDDEPKNLHAMKRLVEHMEVDIVEAASGQEALRAVLYHDFFMILMDVQMPEMNGFEAATLILDNPKTSHIPIIFVTAISKDERFTLKGYQTGAVDYIYKPVDPQILQGKIRVFRELWSRRIELQESNNRLEQLNKQLTETGSALKTANNSLQQEIRERMNTEQALLLAREEADSANQAKSEFLANMSHEIRTPLNAITGFIHLVLKTTLSKKQRNYLNKVKLSSNNLLNVINDILDFSKIEADKIDIEYVPFGLDNVLENLINMMAVKADEKGLELLVDCAPGLPKHLIGDPLRLGQILINLTNNAIKFTEKGEVLIAIELLVQENSTAKIRFKVSDTGIGMTNEQVARLFQPFSQADSSTTRKYGGTGLGLVISHKLLKLMNGEISVVSEPGKGTSFTFTLPFSCSSEDCTTTKISTQIQQAQVLVVDDNQMARSILVGILRSLGIDANSVDSGEAALKELHCQSEDKPYDLVLLDWKMPGMDGLETAYRIQTDNQFEKTPHIVMMTAYTQDEIYSLAQAQQLSLERVLSKPITPSQLLESLQSALCSSGDLITVADNTAVDQTNNIALLKGKRVLLVEDDELNQEIAIELLRFAGLNVTLAIHGQQAVDTLMSKSEVDPPFDIVLMDCQMPVMDGYEATKEIRRNKLFSKLPIIAMTANAMAGDREKCLAAGMNDHLAKPIDSQQLYNILNRWAKAKPVLSPLNQPPLNQPPLNQPPLNQPPLNQPPLNQPQAHPTESGASNEFALSDIPGINAELGINMVGGNKDFYWKILLKFVRQYHGVVDEVRNKLLAGQWEEAQRVIHNIKGSSGSIGAESLHDAVINLEQLIAKRELDDIETALKPLFQATEQIFQKVTQFADYEDP